METVASKKGACKRLVAVANEARKRGAMKIASTTGAKSFQGEDNAPSIRSDPSSANGSLTSLVIKERHRSAIASTAHDRLYNRRFFIVSLD
jgi:hypothetical protein